MKRAWILLVSIVFLAALLPKVSDPVEVHRYQVSGHSVEELSRSLRTYGPRDRSGRVRDAYTKWWIAWSFNHSKNNQIYDVSVNYRAEILVPQWIDESTGSAHLQSEWHRYLETLLHHEYHHVDTAKNNIAKIEEKMREAIRSSPTIKEEELDAIGQRELIRLRVIDDKYDAVTRHGYTEGVVLRE